MKRVVSPAPMEKPCQLMTALGELVMLRVLGLGLVAETWPWTTSMPVGLALAIAPIAMPVKNAIARLFILSSDPLPTPFYPLTLGGFRKGRIPPVFYPSFFMGVLVPIVADLTLNRVIFTLIRRLSLNSRYGGRLFREWCRWPLRVNWCWWLLNLRREDRVTGLGYTRPSIIRMDRPA